MKKYYFRYYYSTCTLTNGGGEVLLEGVEKCYFRYYGSACTLVRVAEVHQQKTIVQLPENYSKHYI